jgi:hypothetical protein
MTTNSIDISDYPSINSNAIHESPALNIPADILHEIIDSKIEESSRQLKEEMRMIAYDMTMKALYNSKPQTQQPQGQEALFWKRVFEIFSEQLPDSPIQLWSFVAKWAKENGVSNGDAIYQYGGQLIQNRKIL